MKTTLNLPSRPPAAPAHQRAATVRLGLIVSVLAALAAVVVHLLTDLPTAVILVPVVVIGFGVSWHATGNHSHGHHPHGHR